MARYIDADCIYQMVENRYRVSSGIEHRCERDLLDLICEAPTADVVPKSEVAKEFTCFVGDPHKVDHCPYLDEIEKAKTEVAREIFAEIETALDAFDGSWANTVINTQYLIAELKKKYIEGEDG